ncbi:MAG: flippase-like domain-containing protein [Acidobacteria bacterium]|nr:flippase-like domain-containing protein [Acidobacteriota bacterium]
MNEALERLVQADLRYISFGAVVYALAYLARGLRLNLVLPAGDRLPFLRAFSLSGAAVFLLQVVPFRAGSGASWVMLKRALGKSWSRAAAVAVLIKVIDTAVMLLAGLLGAAFVSLRRGSPVIGQGALVLSFATILGLVLLPRFGGAVCARLAKRLEQKPRLAAILGELAIGLETARQKPVLYAAAFLPAMLFTAGHLVSLWLQIRGLGYDVPLSSIACASGASLLTTATVPAPVGTFGPMETGFAAGLALDGFPLVTGLFLGACVHLVSTAVAGLVGLPELVRAFRVSRETPPPPPPP